MSYTGFTQAEYGIRILVDAPQEYVNTYSTCRVRVNLFFLCVVYAQAHRDDPRLRGG